MYLHVEIRKSKPEGSFYVGRYWITSPISLVVYNIIYENNIIKLCGKYTFRTIAPQNRNQILHIVL